MTNQNMVFSIRILFSCKEKKKFVGKWIELEEILLNKVTQITCPKEIPISKTPKDSPNSQKCAQPVL